MANNFEFYTGLRGYHVYSNTVGWKPYVQEKIILKRKHKNPHDKFAVAGKVTMKGKIGLIVIGHVPRELSRYVWYSIPEGAKYDVEVHKKTPMATRWVRDPSKSSSYIEQAREIVSISGESASGRVSFHCRIC